MRLSWLLPILLNVGPSRITPADGKDVHRGYDWLPPITAYRPEPIAIQVAIPLTANPIIVESILDSFDSKARLSLVTPDVIASPPEAVPVPKTRVLGKEALDQLSPDTLLVPQHHHHHQDEEQAQAPTPSQDPSSSANEPKAPMPASKALMNMSAGLACVLVVFSFL
ncbi:uncharacterized protein CTHT_0004570 [Thermochaetoides thermophila DSM 1495]|uniref:Uncharacterized protein n=1 Tax=Chaetomium thermophilum (strain DSM 1495 / CBS 144.50 / IMI 039719) TaxID=759272 RepID=G0RXW9_CHATD|nr:hypothetical protein CTHT_0004570 [Thermochaetoides thermophila DSM 1495]EGS23755.1 hypothetical protein CTHT_0004570 [Thermochaetoides thermophila DSM 1495]